MGKLKTSPDITKEEKNQDMAMAILTVSETCRYLKVSQATIYRLLKAGELPHVRIGKSIRFLREALDSYLKKNMTTKYKRVDGRGRPPKKGKLKK